MNHKNTMSYYSTLFQRYGVDDNLLDNRTKKRAIGSVLEQIDKQVVNNSEKIDKARLKKLRRAFGKASWFKNIAAGLTFAMAVTIFQTPPLKADTSLPTFVKSKSNFVNAIMDEDSSSEVLKNDNKAVVNKSLDTTSLHFISNKPLLNEIQILSSNSIFLDDDSDVVYMPITRSNHLTVIDTTIKDWEILAKSINKGAILLLKKEDIALDTILTELKKLRSVESLNIISHGSSGQLHFSDKTISKESLESNKEKWQELGTYLEKDGDINLFGCNIASGQTGKKFIKTLADITNADIGASINPTGDKKEGGDWELELAIGDIENNSLFESNILENFTNVLASVVSFESMSATSAQNRTYTMDGVSFELEGSTSSLKQYSYAAHATSGAKAFNFFDNDASSPTLTIRRTDNASWTLNSFTYGDGSGSGVVATAYLSAGGTTAKTITAGSGTSSWGGISITKLVFSTRVITMNMYIDELDMSGTAAAAAPTVSSVTSTKANGTYKVGDTIDVTVTFTDTVTVTGTPQLTLETGTTDRVVDYVSGSTTNTLTFTYTVQTGDTSADLDFKATTSLALNSGTIKNGATDATLTLASPGAANSLGANKALVVDGVVPTVSSVSSTTANGTYKVGDVIAITVGFSEAVTVTGTPLLTLETGTTDRDVSYSSGSGGATLTFNYTVQAGDTSADLDFKATTSLALNSGTIKDAAGNAATLTLASPGAANSLGSNKALVVDGVVPTVSSVTSTKANGSYKVGEIIAITVTFTETVNVTGTPQLLLETGSTDRTIDYTSGTGTNTLTFNYTVQSGDTAADLDYKSTTALTLNSGTIKDVAGNDATLTLASPGASNSLGNNKALIIDTASATVSYVSSTTANGTFKVGDVVAVTVVFNENMTVTGTPQLTLETGSIDRTVDYASGSGSTTLTFNYTVQSGDTSADLDYTGTSSLTLNNGTIKDAAGNDATLTLANPAHADSLGGRKALVIDGNAPTVSSVSVPANNSYKESANLDFTVNTSEAITVDTGGGTPRLTLTVGGVTKYATYISGTGTTALVFRYTVGAGETDTDGIAVAGTIDANSGTLKDSAGNNLTTTLNSVGATTAILVDTTNPTTSTLSPADNSTGKSISSNLVLTLNENASVGTGDILIKKTTGDVLVETIPVGDGRVTLSGAVITINPNTTLDINTQYYVIVPATAFDDTVGNSFAGITVANNWSFTTASDATAPTISNITIPNTPNKIGDTVTVTFTVVSDSDDYTTGSGTLSGTIGGFTLGSFVKVNDTTYTATFTITSGATDVASSDDIPVNLTMTDSAGNVTGAYTTAISQNNDGIDSNLPTLSSLSPADNATDISVSTNLTITLDENIAKGTGNILIKKTTGDVLVETIDVTSGLVTISGATLTINPTSNFDVNTQYYIQIAATAITDTISNSYVGITDTTSWSFTTTQGTLSTLTGITIEQGSTNNSTKVTYTPQTGNSLRYMYSNSSITTPTYGDSLPSSAVNYTSGTDILYAEVSKYLIIYEVDASSKIVGFKQYFLTSSHINIPTPITGTITKVSVPDQLVDINTSKFVESNGTQVIDINLSQYFTNTSSYSYLKKDTNTTVDWLNLNTSTGDINITSSIVDNNSTLLDTKHFIKITGENSDTNISTYFTIRFKDLNASLAQYMKGTITGATETPKSDQNSSDGRQYDQKDFNTTTFNITTQVFRDGGARHEIVNRAIAESKLPDSKITISANGDLNTSASTINDAGDEVQIEVLGNATGTIISTHKLFVNGVETNATSSIPNTITNIKEDRTVETNATINSTNICVTTMPDGKSEHTVEVGGKTSTASVELAGGHTTISATGVVTTTYNNANAVTSENGTTQVQLNGNSLLNGNFEAGSSAKIYEDGSGDEFIEISTPPATSNIQYLID